MPRDLGDRAQDFRERWLAISGGWLGELTILLSDATGVWDLTILTWIFVGGWIVIRTSPMEIAMIFGLGFDLTIPLQYANDPSLSAKHKSHLDDYWPLFLVATLVEGGSFFLIHPDLFTLIVCLKTVFTTFVWLSRDQDGNAVSRRSGSSLSRPSAPTSTTTTSRSDRDPSRSSSSRRIQRDDSSSRPSSSGTKSKPSNLPSCKHFSDPWKYLGDKYSPAAVAGMIDALNKMDKKKAQKTVQTWRKEKDPKEIARREKSYAAKAKEKGWKPASEGRNASAGSGGGGDNKSKFAISKDEVKRVEAELKKRKVPKDDMTKILSRLKSPKSAEEVKKVAVALEKMGIKVKSGGGGGGSSKSGPSGGSGGGGHTLGEPDGTGLYRDIEIRKSDRDRIIKRMVQKRLPKETIARWDSYLRRPLSRREVEKYVIPQAQAVDEYLGAGYFGGGRHGLKTDKLLKMRDKVRDKCGVDISMADHMILQAINLDTVERVQEKINGWLKDGLAPGEHERLRKTAPDWA